MINDLQHNVMCHTWRLLRGDSAFWQLSTNLVT